jgi:lipopolysaccharide transport system ATP-binding protein
MSDVVLKVEHLYKRYRLGNIDRQAFKEDIIGFWNKLRGLPDPYETYTTSNELAAAKSAEEVKSRYVWSLQDINFEVKKGEVVGIIGKNGAGKSTLLKILSKTTTPTKGQVKIKGRIASLLEVGTGFHPDLTGRENIYMNGAILGMTRYEISRKLDEIVAFAGIEAFIDTPVKRYSSGMYVRLAFAVAAHLEPDILIVDEVLAVGDADFQKKCIGKMKDVSQGEGRTVLFVSHNANAIRALCEKCLLIENGMYKIMGNVDEVLSIYSKTQVTANESNGIVSWLLESRIGNEVFLINSIKIVSQKNIPTNEIKIDEAFKVVITYEVIKEDEKVGLSLILLDNSGNCIFSSTNALEQNFYGKPLKKGIYTSIVEFPPNFLNNGIFVVTIIGFGANWVGSFRLDNILEFEAIDALALRGDYYGNYGGFLRPNLKWITNYQGQ